MSPDPSTSSRRSSGPLVRSECSGHATRSARSPIRRGDLVSLRRLPRRFELDPVRADGHGRRRRPLRRARRAARCRRLRAPQPRLATAHLGRRCLRHGDARLRGSERQPGDRRPRDGGRDRRRRAHPVRPRRRRPGLRGCRRVARRTRRGHLADPRSRADVPDAPGPLREPPTGPGRGRTSTRSPRAPTASACSRNGAGAASSRSGSSAGSRSTTSSSRRRSSSGRPAPPDRSIRSPGCRRRP